MVENKLPFIDERFTDECKKFLIFIHNNIYSDDTAMKILEQEIVNTLNPLNINFLMNGRFKTISLEFENDINFDPFSTTSDILKRFFNQPYVQNILSSCKCKAKYCINDNTYLNLLFNITNFSSKDFTIYL